MLFQSFNPLNSCHQVADRQLATWPGRISENNSGHRLLAFESSDGSLLGQLAVTVARAPAFELGALQTRSGCSAEEIGAALVRQLVSELNLRTAVTSLTSTVASGEDPAPYLVAGGELCSPRWRRLLRRPVTVDLTPVLVQHRADTGDSPLPIAQPLHLNAGEPVLRLVLPNIDSAA